MRPTKRELHELPDTEMLKSGTIRLIVASKPYKPRQFKCRLCKRLFPRKKIDSEFEFEVNPKLQVFSNKLRFSRDLRT